jgi:hypothetical protein
MQITLTNYSDHVKGPTKYLVLLCYLTAFQVWSQIWDHYPHHFVVLSHNFVSFGQKIKVNIDLETRESRAHDSIVVNRRPIPLVSAGSRFDPRFFG